jgi:hypothetical protein
VLTLHQFFESLLDNIDFCQLEGHIVKFRSVGGYGHQIITQGCLVIPLRPVLESFQLFFIQL